MGYLSESGLTTLWAKLKATFATITHSHGDATTSASGMISSEDKTKLNGIASGAEVNVQADWNESDSSSDAFIANKPTIPTVPTDISAFNNDVGYLTSHQSIKTINGNTMVGTGDVDVTERAIWLGTCSSAAGEQNKVVTCTGFTLKVGAVIGVEYAYTNTYSATAAAPVTLNVNNTGAKQIYYNNTATPTGTNTTVFGYANRCIFYVYDGTYWVWLSHGTDNNTTYSVMSVSEMDTGTATTGRLLSAARIKATLQRKATASTTDLTAGASALDDGEIYLVYE